MTNIESTQSHEQAVTQTVGQGGAQQHEQAGAQAGGQGGAQQHEQAGAQAGGQEGAQQHEQAGAQAGGQEGAQQHEQAGAQAGGQGGAQQHEQSGAQAGGQRGAQQHEQSGAQAGGQNGTQNKSYTNEDSKCSNSYDCLIKITHDRSFFDVYVLSGFVILILCSGIVICFYSIINTPKDLYKEFILLLIIIICIITILFIYRHIFNLINSSREVEKRMIYVINELNKLFKSEITSLKNENELTRTKVEEINRKIKR